MVKWIAEQKLASTILLLRWGAREAVHEALCDRLGTAESMTRAAAQAEVSALSRSGATTKVRGPTSKLNSMFICCCN